MLTNLVEKNLEKSRKQRLGVYIKDVLFNLLIYFHNHIVTNIPSHAIRRFFLRRMMRLEMGQGSATLLGLRLYTRGNLTIANHSVIDRGCVLDARGEITLGNNVNLAPEVMVLTASHDPDDESFAGIEKPVVVEDYAWIATRSLILPGVTIGRGAIVGAGSVVTKNVEPGTIVAGNPARLIRERQGNQTYQLNYTRLFH